jgi:hypothetical protein
MRNTTSVENFEGMFIETSSFNYSLDNWDMRSATNVFRMLSGAGLSIYNYNATLSGWAVQDVHTGLGL